MKHILYIVFLFLGSFASYTQSLAGTWKGSFYPQGSSPDKGKIMYLSMPSLEANFSVKIRNEVLDSEDFALKQAKGTKKGVNSFDLTETVVYKKASGSRTNWCRLQMQLTYNQETGYITGTYTSSECRNFIGLVILYRDKVSFPEDIVNEESQHWLNVLTNDLKKGLNAPEIREKERNNFVFQPIYFDYDKSDIRPEFHDFLNRMIHVIEGHSDLRVKVTGHTDSDGSDQYNDGLSQRRAKAIVDYFVAKGLTADRLEFDFKGEKKPVDTNSTSEGRQKNRRVEFQFI